MKDKPTAKKARFWAPQVVNVFPLCVNKRVRWRFSHPLYLHATVHLFIIYVGSILYVLVNHIGICWQLSKFSITLP